MPEVENNISNLQEQYDFTSMPIWKLVLMEVLSLGAYSIIWAYNQWKVVKNGHKIAKHPILLSLIYVITFFWLFPIIDKFYANYKQGQTLITHTKSTSFLLLVVLCNFCNGLYLNTDTNMYGNILLPILGFALMFGYILILINVQKRINLYNKKYNLQYEQNKWSKKSIIFTSFATLYFIIVLNGIYSIYNDSYSSLSLKEQKQIGVLYSFIYSSSDGLEEYCKQSGYIPNVYLKKFNTATYKTRQKAIDNFKLLPKNEQENIKMALLDNNNTIQENSYSEHKIIYPNATRAEYCKYYDDNSDKFTNNLTEALKAIDILAK